jgi:ribonuclease BN (tRNA processing enzyme)
MEVRLTVVGCSPAWPNPGGAQSGYLVESEGARLLLDCGPGVLARLRALEDWPRVDSIAITHFHLDHWGDLVPWVWALAFGPARDLAPPELWVPPRGKTVLWDLGRSLGTPDMFEQAFSVHEFAKDEAFATVGFDVVPRKVVHYDLDAYAFRVSANGATLAYSGDSGPSEELVEIARDADLFLCEATLGDGQTEAMRGHLSPAEANDAFSRAGARRLLLTHRPKERPLDPSYEQVHDGFELEL